MAQTKRRPTLMESGATNETVALYARVSTEDQAERATIQAQLDFLRRYVDLHSLPVAGEYVDDGISGTVPLQDRPEGQRLLRDAAVVLDAYDHHGACKQIVAVLNTLAAHPERALEAGNTDEGKAEQIERARKPKAAKP